jgi:hypothetical protein
MISQLTRDRLGAEEEEVEPVARQEMVIVKVIIVAVAVAAPS